MAAKIGEVGSMKLDLHKLALRIFEICNDHCINLEIDWIPRDSNTRVDFVSKFVDVYDSQVTDEVFNILNDLWGPFMVDCYANYYNEVDRFLFQVLEPRDLGG